MTIDVYFIDAGREAQCKPDPKYPDGIHVDLRKTAADWNGKSCTYNLQYPAPRCGIYKIVCKTCGYRAAITVAGRPDDPRTVQMPCKAKGLDS